jgi:nucleotide-binding universal stress UspA family protein
VFARVIVGIDGAGGGLDAAALAGVLADPEADIVLAHVMTDGAETRTDALAAARAVLEAPIEDGAGPDVSEVRVDGRSVAGGLHRLAQELAADLIAVGSHHRRATGRLWSADRTRTTLRDAPCPVAVAPQGFAPAARQPIRVLGIAYDDTPEARDALLFGRALASESGAQIHALWVVDRSNWTDSESRVGWKAVDATRRLADFHGVIGIVLEADAHHPREALSGLAHEVDLLILGSHHHTFLRRIVLGDTVEGLSRRTPCPLLVLPHARDRAAR